ncbi:ORF MSV073 hypothetical protein [Melanoplus sanguinipes entomopoxvirus]|uniref:Uncharacterized protein n=1 Tax=Melanoplus sanguinipes entomopoxvirus TaxID=83191 RepID=Q9YW18_MSEPV|nr:ORF MSV073 hypothetical protein [Melanoplus sanguinipes entomopoxvirus]AAC97629.1 ORF MSV073 hypothetical protein [Melanoplus sanguinipes entomopoxvirus 'O']
MNVDVYVHMMTMNDDDGKYLHDYVNVNVLINVNVDVNVDNHQPKANMVFYIFSMAILHKYSLLDIY